MSASPPPHTSHPRSPGPGFQNYGINCHAIGTAQPSTVSSQQSLPSYPHEPGRPGDQEPAWERHGPPPEPHREWESCKPRRGQTEYHTHPTQQPHHHFHSSGPHCTLSPMDTLPHLAHPSCTFLDSELPGGPPHPRPPLPPGPPTLHHHPCTLLTRVRLTLVHVVHCPLVTLPRHVVTICEHAGSILHHRCKAKR
ncbi:hypothetical protein BV22DRAFT_1187954 [Leucogyrophana mollusca]|uniref:Uncharacterized protein n=1 Tax=Leucogyrophana mollusca TaxID=85980 RepID=A0ACB8AYZ3_9AGAM|nr:hypothetical protein BV22DRAFT_1187954 [Leucogyrophana mollusca]